MIVCVGVALDFVERAMPAIVFLFAGMARSYRFFI